MNKFRSKGFWIGTIGILYMLVSQFIKIDETMWSTFANLIAMVLVAFGILSDTSGEQHDITKEFILEKLKSPVAIGAILALAYYVIEIAFNAEALAIAEQIGGLIMLLGFGGFGVINNPNNRDGL